MGLAVRVLAEQHSAEVLIVEDDPILLEALVELVSQLGHPAIGATGGHEALAYLRGAATLPRLIMTDLLMPLMSGDELVTRLRNDEAFATIPVAILTAAGASVGDAAGKVAAVPILAKSLRSSDLVAFIEARCPPRCTPETTAIHPALTEQPLPA